MFQPPHVTRSTLALGAGLLLTVSTPASALAAWNLHPAEAANVAPVQARYYDDLDGNGEPAQDLRSPDARDAARPASATAGSATAQDLRSPDTRDRAIAAGARTRPIRAAAAITTVSDDFDRGDAAIGAGAALGTLLLMAGGGALIRRHGSERKPDAVS